MPREKSPERKKAETLLRKGMKATEIAEKLGVPAGSVRRWKAEMGNAAELKKAAEKRSQKASANERSKSKKRGGQRGNINSVENEGGAAPTQNKNAEIHGLYVRFLPKETMEIMDALREEDPLDKLWGQILNQQAVILRSQRIFEMHRGKKTEEVVSSGGAGGTAYMIQEPWDKEAQYLAAFSRAQGTLQSMIKTYMEMEGKSKQEAAADSKDWVSAILQIKMDREKKAAGADPAMGDAPGTENKEDSEEGTGADG